MAKATVVGSSGDLASAPPSPWSSAPLVKGPPPSLWAPLEAGPPVWRPALTDIDRSGSVAPVAFAAPETVIGVPVTHEEALQSHGEDEYLEALEDEEMDYEIQHAAAQRWENCRNALIALQLQSVSCNCPACRRVDLQAEAILQTGDLAHTLLGDATPAAAPVVEFIVGSAQLESSSPAAVDPAATPVSVRCEREFMRRLLLDMPLIPVVVDDDSVAEVVAPATPTAPEATSSSALPDTEDLPEAADSLHDMD